MKKLPRCLLLMCVLSAFAADADADIIGFGKFSGYTINWNDLGAAPSVIPGKIHLTYTGDLSGESRSIFYGTPQPVGHFTASFTYQCLNTNGVPDAGACFVLQNSSSGVYALGSYASQLGYGQYHMSPSVAISLELDPSFASKTTSGLHTNGVVLNGAPSTSPVNLLSGDPINVSLAYDGSILSETLLDTVTSASYNTGYLINLPNTLGGSTAWSA